MSPTERGLRPELEVRPQDICLVVDIGSTLAKATLVNLSTTQEISSKPTTPGEKLKYWLDYPSEPKAFGSCKWGQIDGTQLLAEVNENVQTLLADFGVAREALGAEVYTGMVHSLAVASPDKTVVISENPPLKKEISEKENKILADFSHVPEDKYHLRPDSLLMKLLTLRSEPGLVAEIFGPGITFKDLRFTTFTGLLAGALADGRPGGIPLAHAYSLTGNRNSTLAEANELLQKLGLSESVQVINDRELVSRLGRRSAEINVVLDFSAELTRFLRLWQTGVLDPEDLAIDLDTWGKLIFELLKSSDPKKWPYCRPVDLRPYQEKLVYTTHPVGTVYNSWMRGKLTRGLWPEEEDRDVRFYTHVQATLQEGMNETDNPFLFDPLAVDPQGGNIGALYSAKVSGQEQFIEREQITQAQALNLPLGQRKQAIRAISRGIFFSLRDYIERMQAQPELGLDFAGKIYLYGGMTLNPAWMETASQCLGPHFQLAILQGMTSCMESAAEYAALLQGRDPAKMAVPVITPIPSGTDRSAEYYRWQSLMGRGIIHIPPVIVSNGAYAALELPETLKIEGPKINKQSLGGRLLGRELSGDNKFSLEQAWWLCQQLAQAKGVLAMTELKKRGIVPKIFTKETIIYRPKDGTIAINDDLAQAALIDGDLIIMATAVTQMGIANDLPIAVAGCAAVAFEEKVSRQNQGTILSDCFDPKAIDDLREQISFIINRTGGRGWDEFEGIRLEDYVLT